MSRAFAIAGLLAGLPLAAQVYLATGDSRLTLTHLVHDHPEGLLLTLPSASGQSLAPGLVASLGQEPALELRLGTQKLALSQPAGRELAGLRGWTSERPHWALVGRDGQVVAEGTEAPTAARLAELYHRSPLRTRAERLQAFLKDHPDQLEAQALLILELRSVAERRTELLWARTETKPTGESPATPRLLSEAEDGRIWGAYAEAYRRFMQAGAWPVSPADSSSPLPLAAQLSSFATSSPQLRDLAARLLPEVEGPLRARLSDERRWKVWLSLRAAGAGGRPADLFAGAAPPPGTKHWPPEAALDAFVADAEERDDWRDAEGVLQAAYDRTQDLLKALDAAAREDAGGQAPARLGSYFGYGGWSGETALLVEAKLRLGKLQEADRIFREAFARAPRPEVAREAAALARRCGVESLAVQWAQLAP